MIKIENFEVMGWDHAIRGMRNPMNSWEKSDSYETHIQDSETLETADFEFFVGENDHKLMMNLAHGGPVHAKYRRMIVVYLDITAPLYWWKECDTYKVGTVANSCSTMHKIHAKRFEMDDFSTEHLIDFPEAYEDDCVTLSRDVGEDFSPMGIMELTIDMLNVVRQKYLYTLSKPMKEEGKRSVNAKRYWWQMIQLLPSSYNQKRTIMLNYEVLHNMYESRKHHKLDEWREFCKWIESLPYSELIIGEDIEG